MERFAVFTFVNLYVTFPNRLHMVINETLKTRYLQMTIHRESFVWVISLLCTFVNALLFCCRFVYKCKYAFERLFSLWNIDKEQSDRNGKNMQKNHTKQYRERNAERKNSFAVLSNSFGDSFSPNSLPYRKASGWEGGAKRRIIFRH